MVNNQLEHSQKKIDTDISLLDIKQQIGRVDLYNDKLGVTSCQQLLMPADGLRYIEWGFTDNSLRLFSTDTGKLLNVFENMHVGYISSACFPDSCTLVTGGTDNVSFFFKKKEKSVLKVFFISLYVCGRLKMKRLQTLRFWNV